MYIFCNHHMKSCRFTTLLTPSDIVGNHSNRPLFYVSSEDFFLKPSLSTGRLFVCAGRLSLYYFCQQCNRVAIQTHTSAQSVIGNDTLLML